MAKVTITGLPKAGKGMHVRSADPSGKATIEAEAGETMIAANPISNRKEHVAIGGKKHGQGGTELQAKEGDAVYSDRLKIKDPVVLRFFGETGKKPRTIAQIAKKYKLSQYQDDRANEGNDRITNASLDKTIDNANFKLSALFTFQEFHEDKDSPTEPSAHFEAFMNRTGVSFDQIMGVEGEAEPGQEQAPREVAREPIAAYGTEVKFNPLPKMHEGGPVGHRHGQTEYVSDQFPKYNESTAFGKEGIEWLNTFLSDYNIETIDPSAKKSKEEILKSVTKAQIAAITENPELVLDFMTRGKDGVKSHRPNNELQGIMTEIQKKFPKKYKPTGKDGWSNTDLISMLESNDIDKQKILDGYQDNKWWYRMVNDRVATVSQEELNNIMKTPEWNDAIEQGGKKYIYRGQGIYEAYVVGEDGNVKKVQPDPKVLDKLNEWDLKHIEPTAPDEDNMDFLWANKRALARDRKAKRNIPNLEPFTAVADTQYTDQAYYDPTQAINSILAESEQRGEKFANFAGSQQQAANMSATQPFEALAKVTAEYADKNVNAYNRERMTNTQIANRSSERLAGAIQGHHDKNTILKQNYANAMTKADNKIANSEIAMWEERATRLNMEKAIGEQFRTDPNTGIQIFNKGKDFFPGSAGEKSVADVFGEIKDRFPGIDDKAAKDMAMATMSGKYEYTDNGTSIPNQRQYSN